MFRPMLWLTIAMLGCAPGDTPTLADSLPLDQLTPPQLVLETQGVAVRGELLQIRLPLPAAVSGVRVFFPTSETGPGSSVCPPVLNGQCLSIAAPIELVGPAISDASGVARATIPVSPTAPDELFIQGVVLYNGNAFLSDPIRVDVYDTAPCTDPAGCPTDTGSTGGGDSTVVDTGTSTPDTLVGVGPTVAPSTGSEAFDCGFLQPAGVVDPVSGDLTEVQVTLDRSAERWFVEPMRGGEPAEPRLVLEFGSTSGATPELSLASTSDLSRVTADLADFTARSSGILGSRDIASIVGWQDLSDPVLSESVDLQGLTAALDGGSPVGDLGELRAACVVARMVSQATAMGDTSSLVVDRFWSRVQQQGGVVRDACLWSDPSDRSCTGLYDPRDFLETSIGHPVYSAASWADIEVGRQLASGLNSPFDVYTDPGFDLSQPGGGLAAGDYANDWSLGGLYDPFEFEWTATKLLDNELDRRIYDHIHTWEIRNDFLGKVNYQSTMVAYSPLVDADNRGCFEPGSGEAAELPTCQAIQPSRVYAGCELNGVAKGFGDCLNHPRRFQRRREFHGPGAPECPSADRFTCLETPNLLITSDWDRCEAYNTDPAYVDWTCVPFPEYMRVYFGGTRPVENAENASVFRVSGFSEVEIEGITIDVLPHPIFGQIEELDASTLTGLEKLENTLTDHIGHNFRSQVARGTVDGKWRTYFGELPVDASGATDYDQAWATWRDAMYLNRRVHTTGNVFEFHENDFLNFHDNNMRFIVKEGGIQIRSTRAVSIERNWMQGQSLGRLQAMGLPMDDDLLGAGLVVTALNGGSYQLDDMFMMGSGIIIDNNRNGDFTAGFDCCREPYDSPGGALSIPTCDRDAPSYADGARNYTEYSGRGDYCTANDASCDVLAVYIAQNTIRDCTLEKFFDSNGQGNESNHDGMVLMNAPGFVFSNELSNFMLDTSAGLQCNTLIDVANRRPCDLDWTGKTTRLERNILSTGLIKTEGAGEPGNAVTWANNIMTNVPLQDYHQKWTSYYLHNSYNVTADASLRSKGYVWSEASTQAHGWHPEPALFFGRNSLRFGDRSTSLLQRSHFVAGQDGLLLDQNLMFGFPNKIQYAVIGSMPFRGYTSMFDPPVGTADPEVACTVFAGVTGWYCYDTVGVPDSDIVTALGMKTTMGSKFSLRGQPDLYVAPDGYTTSTNPEDVLVAMRGEPMEANGVTPADYAWWVDHEVMPDDSVGLDCASGYVQRKAWTRWWDEGDTSSPHNPACNWETFFGSEAFVTMDVSEQPLSCNSTTTPRVYDATYVADLMFVDVDQLGKPGDPYRAALESYVNPFASGTGGMDTPAQELSCLANQSQYTVVSSDPTVTVRRAVADTLESHLVRRLGPDQPTWLRVERDFCGNPRSSDTTVGAFELGSTCPGAF